jgi:prepilin-type N-terminal cleavage/methylation domain-containing protein
MKSRLENLNQQKGFTLLEMIVVVVVVMIFLAFTTVGTNIFLMNSRDTTRKAQLAQLQQGLDSYQSDSLDAIYPTTLQGLNVLQSKFIKEIPVDPSTRQPYTYTALPIGCDNTSVYCKDYVLTTSFEANHDSYNINQQGPIPTQSLGILLATPTPTNTPVPPPPKPTATPTPTNTPTPTPTPTPLPTMDNATTMSKIPDGKSTQMVWPHTVGINSNRLLIVAVVSQTSGNAGSATSVTYGKAFLTKLASKDSTVRVELWYLVNPASGTDNISVTGLNTATDLLSIATSWYNVDQSSPFGISTTLASGNNTGTGPLTITNTTASDRIYDIIGGDTMISLTPGSGQALLGNTSSDGYQIAVSQKYSSDGNTYMSWTFNDFTHFAYIGVPLKRAASPPVLGF